MSFDGREGSWEDGAPVEFYEFVKGTTFKRYNTSDRTLTLLGEDWVPLSISRENIQQGSERNKLTLSVEIPRSAEVFAWWHPYPTSSTVGLTIYAGHVGETEAAVVWTGRLVSPKFKPQSFTMMCEPTTTISKKTGQVQCWQRNCMHVLYSQGHGLCNANPDDFSATGTISDSTATVVEAVVFGTYPDRRLEGGYIEWPGADGSTERRTIRAHVGTSCNLMYGTNQLPIGTEFTVFPGCRRNFEDCETYFNNQVNYGGDPYAPERSPFNGQPVF